MNFSLGGATVTLNCLHITTSDSFDDSVQLLVPNA